MMNWMTGWLCFGMASAAFAGEVAIGWRENGGADVPAGETAQQTERVAIDPEGNFLKTGAGTLEMPLGTVDNAIPSTVKVLAGTLKLTTAAAPEADVAHPPAILDTAAFWVDAMPDAGLVISNGTATAESDTTPAYALRWLDRRETNPDAPTRLYADAAWTNNTESALWGVPPAVVNVDGRRAVFFGG